MQRVVYKMEASGGNCIPRNIHLIANLLLSLLQSTLKRRWSFSGLATMVRIVLMYYLNLEKFFNQPDADLNKMLAEVSKSPPQKPDFD